MYVLRSNETSGENVFELEHDTDFNVNEGDEFWVRCTASGSNPPAKMDISFGGKNINSQFNLKNDEYNPVPEPGAMRDLPIAHDVLMTSKEPFIVTQQMSRTDLTCTASIPRYDPLFVTIRPILRGTNENLIYSLVSAILDFLL